MYELSWYSLLSPLISSKVYPIFSSVIGKQNLLKHSRKMDVNILKKEEDENLKKNMHKKIILDSIPTELIIDIVAHVAANSCKDLFCTKLRYPGLILHSIYNL